MVRRQGEDPRALKSEQRQTIQRTGVVIFQKAADEWLASTSSKLAATTLKDYKNKLENQILPVFSKRSIKAITQSECLDLKRTIEARGARNQSDKVFGLLRQVFSYAIDHAVALPEDSGILIGADDFRAMLRSGSTERWLVCGDDRTNSVIHLQRAFSI